MSPFATQLTWSHYTELLPIKDMNKLNYYLNLVISQSLDVRSLRDKIKTNEYERLPEETRVKLITIDTPKVEDFVKNPILIKNNSNYEIISEKILKQFILEDIDNFLLELGVGFSYIKNE